MKSSKGIIPINKPKDWTSFDVVNKLKYKLKPHKVGHLGTLDPMATGVLLVTVGKATKLFDIMQEKTKTYRATFEFGYVTDTLDATGIKLEDADIIPTEQQILKVLPKFVGEIEQMPPKYSAKSINGKRAYDLARQNIDFELKPKKVKIYEINFISYENNILELEIVCGSGTYIRSIGRDVAKELNSLATMTQLTRTKVGTFKVEDCYDINNIDLENNIIPIKDVLNYETLNLTEQESTKLLNGITLGMDKPDGIYSLQTEIDIVALIKIQNKKAKMHIFLG